MCLGVPGKVVEVFEEHGVLMGKVDFGGLSRPICLAHTPEVLPGQYVIVHVGFALQIVDEEAARQIFAFLRQIDDIESPPAEEDATGLHGEGAT